FRGQPLGFPFGATAGFLFGLALRYFFDAPPFASLGAHLCFNLGTQAGLIFCPATGLCLRLAASILCDAAALGFFGQGLGISICFDASLFASRDAFDLFFNRAESWLAAVGAFV